MSEKQSLLERIRKQDATLQKDIEGLQLEAERVPGGIREFRAHRVQQLRERHGFLRERLRRVESHVEDAWEDVKNEAESLVLDLQDTANLVSQTFH